MIDVKRCVFKATEYIYLSIYLSITFNLHLGAMHRGYLLFLGEYQKYFIECVENATIFNT